MTSKGSDQTARMFKISYMSTTCSFRRHTTFILYSKTCLKRPLKNKTKIGFQDRLSLNVGQKYCRMLQGEHSAILATYIKLPLVIKIFVSSIFEWLLKPWFTIYAKRSCYLNKTPVDTMPTFPWKRCISANRNWFKF